MDELAPLFRDAKSRTHFATNSGCSKNCRKEASGIVIRVLFFNKKELAFNKASGLVTFNAPLNSRTGQDNCASSNNNVEFEANFTISEKSSSELPSKTRKYVINPLSLELNVVYPFNNRSYGWRKLGFPASIVSFMDGKTR